MGTTFPAAVDTLTNPLPIDGLDNPPHATQHADANDAIEALEAVSVGPAFFNVKGYGAEGDGVTDDTAAINAALAAADAAGGGTVLFPYGRYLISSPIYAAPGTCLRGSERSAPSATEIFLSAGFAGDGAIVATGYRDNISANQGSFTVKNLRLNGNGVAGVHGIITLGSSTFIQGCIVVAFGGDGIRLTRFTDNGTGLSGVGLNAQMIVNNYITQITGSGIKLNGPTDGHISGNSISHCGEHGIGTDISGGSGAGGWQISGNHIADCGQHGIHNEAATAGTIICNNDIEDFGTSATTGSYAGISLPSCNEKGVVVTGNNIWTDESVAGSNYRLIDIASNSGSSVNVSVLGNLGRGAGRSTGIEVRLTTAGTGVYAEVVGNTIQRTTAAVNLAADVVRMDGNSFQYATAAPSLGTWRVGNRVWNSAPSAGGVAGWVNTVAGTPGTFEELRLSSGATTFATLHVTGGTTLAGGLNSSASTLASLQVTGGTTLSGGLQSSNTTVNNIAVAGSATVSGNIIDAGVLVVQGGNSAVASLGHIRLPNNAAIRGRTSANDANIALLAVNASDQVIVGDTARTLLFGAVTPTSYTLSASTATRVVPTTVSTSSTATTSLNTYGDRINSLISVVNNLVTDFQTYRLLK